MRDVGEKSVGCDECDYNDPEARVQGRSWEV